MLCTHEHCSGRLSLAADHLVVLSVVVCDDCGHERGGLTVCGKRDEPRLTVPAAR